MQEVRRLRASTACAADSPPGGVRSSSSSWQDAQFPKPLKSIEAEEQAYEKENQRDGAVGMPAQETLQAGERSLQLTMCGHSSPSSTRAGVIITMQ